MDITRLEGALKVTNPHLISRKGKPICLYTIGWKYPIHIDTPTMIGWNSHAQDMEC